MGGTGISKESALGNAFEHKNPKYYNQYAKILFKSRAMSAF